VGPHYGTHFGPRENRRAHTEPGEGKPTPIIILEERATGLEPATSSLGSMPVFTDYCVTRQAFGTYSPPLAPRTVKIGAESATNSDQQ
jgi:hypothetical protein